MATIEEWHEWGLANETEVEIKVGAWPGGRVIWLTSRRHSGVIPVPVGTPLQDVTRLVREKIGKVREGEATMENQRQAYGDSLTRWAEEIGEKAHGTDY